MLGPLPRDRLYPFAECCAALGRNLGAADNTNRVSCTQRVSSLHRTRPLPGGKTPGRVNDPRSSLGRRLGEAARRVDRLNRRVWCKCAALSGCASAVRCARTWGRCSCLALSADEARAPHPDSGFSPAGRCGSFEGSTPRFSPLEPSGEVEHDLWAGSGRN